MPFQNPNYTQVPNDLLGEWIEGQFVPGMIAEMKPAELRLILALCRITFGFHRNESFASWDFLMEMTGLSREGLRQAIGSLEARDLIARKVEGKTVHWIVNHDGLNQENGQSTTVDYIVNHGRLNESTTVDTRKKERKKEERKKGSSTSVDDNGQSGLTEGQRMFLGLFGGKRFKTLMQKETIGKLEKEYGLDRLREGAEWAAKRGMNVGAAICALETALPKWGRPKGSTTIVKGI